MNWFYVLLPFVPTKAIGLVPIMIWDSLILLYYSIQYIIGWEILCANILEQYPRIFLFCVNAFVFLFFIIWGLDVVSGFI